MKRACLKNSNKFLFLVILIIGLVMVNVSIYKVHGQSPQTKTEIQQPVKYICPMHTDVIKDAPGKCPKCGMDLVKMEVVKYTCPMHSEIIRDKPGTCPICGMDLVKMQPVAVVKYTCPMHPEVIKEKPGKCPVCGMDLVVKKEAKK